MIIEVTRNKYGIGNIPDFNIDFDYLLFRQDWDCNESVFFKKHEIDEVLENIEQGQILIHSNYSLLFCRNQDLLNEINGLIGCYTLLKT